MPWLGGVQEHKLPSSEGPARFTTYLCMYTVPPAPQVIGVATLFRRFAGVVHRLVFALFGIACRRGVATAVSLGIPRLSSFHFESSVGVLLPATDCQLRVTCLPEALWRQKAVVALL